MLKFHVDSLALLNCEDLLLATLLGNLYSQFIACCTLNHYVEVATKSSNILERSKLPIRRYLWLKLKATHTRRTDAEHTLGDDTAIESTLCREVSLAALGPRLDRIWHVVAQQTTVRVV